MKKNRAFTLAEVLITLVIIGVIAAITIPILISNYQKTQYVTSLKKAYTTITQALKEISADYGCVNDLKCTGLFSYGGSEDKFSAELIKHIKLSKDCGLTKTTDQECWPKKTFRNFDSTGNVINMNDNSNETYKIITIDGMSFEISNSGFQYEDEADCVRDASNGSTGDLTQVCGSITIDVNGLKGPNTMGRDTFRFFIANGKGATLYPAGGKDESHWWNTTNGWACGVNGYSFGDYCAGRIMEDGWQMNY